MFPISRSRFPSGKVCGPNDRVQFLHLAANQAKRRGRQIKMRPDWEDRKLTIMHNLLVHKFNENLELLGRWSGGGHMARIYQDGVLIREIDLDSLSAPLTFTVEFQGRTNTITAQPGRIRVESADCPDQVCVDQGWISDGTVPVVCLPNRLVIQIEGGGDGLDSATG